jgi:hypothetical protein
VEFGMAATLCKDVVTKVKSLQICWQYQHVNIVNVRATFQSDDPAKPKFRSRTGWD